MPVGGPHPRNSWGRDFFCGHMLNACVGSVLFSVPNTSEDQGNKLEWEFQLFMFLSFNLLNIC